ncbi:MAG TPA: FKBP-type peptidyl-prolyl cis-trans isomerase [Vicinamibacterales bacterium]
MRPFLSTIAFSLLLFTLACGGDNDNGSPTSPTNPPPQGPATLQVVDLTTGTGAEAAGNRVVTVHYTLWLYDPAGTDTKGLRIDASRDHGGSYSFRLGTNAVIPGFEQGLNGMRVGGVRRVTVPPSLAYGSQGSGNVPPNSWLVFEIELLDVTD